MHTTIKNFKDISHYGEIKFNISLHFYDILYQLIPISVKLIKFFFYIPTIIYKNYYFLYTKINI